MLLIRDVRGSNGSRFRTRATLQVWDYWRVKELSNHLLSKAGRLHKGSTVCYSKGRRKKVSAHLINYGCEWMQNLSCTLMIRPVFGKTAWVAVRASNLGSLSITPATTLTRMFRFSWFSAIYPMHKLLVNAKFLCDNPTPLRYIKNFALISNVESKFLTGAKFARAAGTSCKLLGHNWLKASTLLTLPSGQKKSFNMECIALLGISFTKSLRKLHSGKAGFWRMQGHKSKVRGVAMNPVDHPHGGRTKSIKNPRTPWGLTAKYKN